MTKGSATIDGTLRLAKRHNGAGLPESAYRKLGRTGLVTSVVGFGCYRIDNDTPDHKSGLEKALAEGCNLIDTSTNYTDGGSETCVGEILESHLTLETLRRDEIIVVSKVGYVQGQNLELVREQERAGTPFPEVVKYMDGCWHCIHPRFIEEQLSRSLDRLRLERLDIYLLHNPEYFFSDAEKRGLGTPLPKLRDEFYDWIRRAFTALEEEVEKGRIGAYGVSSNTFAAEPGGFETTSATRMWQIAGDIAEARTGDRNRHHFSVIQLPANLFESGPVFEKNNGEANSETVLDFARGKELGVLVNRPLNAIVGGQMVRLADFKTPEIEGTIADYLTQVSVLETDFGDTLAPLIKTSEDSVGSTEFFRWARELSSPEIDSLPMEHWMHLETQVIQPQVSHLVHQLDNHFKGDAAKTWVAWRDRYLPRLERLLLSIRGRCSRQSRLVSLSLSKRLAPFLPAELREESLSRKAIGVLVNTPGISCVLNGMRDPDYVADSLGVLKFPSFEVKRELYRAFQVASEPAPTRR